MQRTPRTNNNSSNNLENQHREARQIMAGRELNEQIEESKNILRRAVESGAREACVALNIQPDSALAKEITSTYVFNYLTNKDNVAFVQAHKSEPNVVTQDVKNKIVALYQQSHAGEIEFRDDKEEIVRRLKSNVVRLTFTKNNGENRVMYATLVPELLNIYNGHRRKYGDQGTTSLLQVDEINKSTPDMVRVLDLEKEEFRAFKPSRLNDYDNDFNVPSWIECHPENDAWYKVVKEGHDIREFVDANGLFVQTEASPDRRQREARYIHEAQENGVLVDDETAKALEYIASNSDKTVKAYIYTLTRLVIPDEVQEYINTNQFFRDLQELCDALKETSDAEFNGEEYSITKRPQKLNGGGVYYITIGTDQYYFHPYFVLNRRTGKVYLDRMGWINEVSASRELPRPVKRVDRLFESTINEFIEEKAIKELPLPQRKRIRKTDMTYETRLRRLQSFAKNPKKAFQPVYDHYNISAKEIPSNSSVQVKLKGQRLTFEISPTGIVATDLVENKPIKLVTVQRGTSTLRELQDGLDAYKAKYRGTIHEERVREGVAIMEEIFLLNIFNLRRKNIFPELLDN